MVLMPFILSLNPRQQTSVAAKGIDSLTEPDAIQVPYGTAFASIGLPATVEATFTNADPGTVSVTWSNANYDSVRSGVVTLIGTPIEDSIISNPDDLTVTIDVDVYRVMEISADHVEFIHTQSLLGYLVHSEHACHFYRERILYNPVDDKTYFAYSHSYNHKPYSQAKILVYDPERGFDRPSNVGSVITVSDTHNGATLMFANSRINVFQETVHDTAMRQHVSTGYDPSNFSILGTIGTKMSYCHPIEKADGNFAIWHRGYVSPDTGYYGIWIVEASSGMTTWGAQRQVTARPTAGGDHRHYPFLPFGRYKANGRIYVGWMAVNLAGPHYYRNHIAWTPDSGADCLKVFHNIQETFSKDVVVSGAITDAESETNFAYMTMSSSTVNGAAGTCTISPEGKFYALVPDEPGGGNAINLKYYDDVEEEWVIKPLTVSGGSEVVGQYMTAMYLIALSNNDIRYMERFTHGSFTKPHFVRTTDEGDTWTDLGDLNPDVTDRSIRYLIPFNICDIPQDTNFPMYFTSQEGATDLTDLVCRVAAWGEIQASPGVTITPAVSMNYNSTGLFHYKAIDAAMTRSGNNILTLIDQFGIRNATATNNPQWDGVDTATLTSASSHRIAVGTPASLVDKTSLTFLAVVKTTGTTSVILDFSLNSATNKYYEFQVIPSGAVRVNMVNTSTHTVDSQDTLIDGNFHVIGIRTNGVNTVHIYVDGVRQYFQTSLVDASGDTVWDDIATGPVNIGANIVHIGYKDLSSGDVNYNVIFKEMALFSGSMPEAEIQARIKMLCDAYSITYVGENQFQVP